MFVYVLRSTTGRTYIGATVDLDRRLRQHNGEIKGGAKATKRAVDKGSTWTRMGYVSGFPTWQSALQFEWKWKQLSRLQKEPKGFSHAMERKQLALDRLLALPQSTRNAVPFSQWPSPPVVHWATHEAPET
jgi:structure-specific endonuclease subunit SLX1